MVLRAEALRKVVCESRDSPPPAPLLFYWRLFLGECTQIAKDLRWVLYAGGGPALTSLNFRSKMGPEAHDDALKYAHRRRKTRTKGPSLSRAYLTHTRARARNTTRTTQFAHAQQAPALPLI